jgi:hypothetical protein
MTTNNPNTTIELIRVLNNSVLALGVKKVITYLKWITMMNGNDRKDVADLIIYSVCEKFKVSPSNILESERNDGGNNDAVCLIAVLLKKHALMSQNQIAIKLNRHKSQISKYIRKMQMLNIELFKHDRKLSADFKLINDSIEQLIQNEQQTWLNQNEEGDQESPLTH